MGGGDQFWNNPWTKPGYKHFLKFHRLVTFLQLLLKEKEIPSAELHKIWKNQKI